MRPLGSKGVPPALRNTATKSAHRSACGSPMKELDQLDLDTAAAGPLHQSDAGVRVEPPAIQRVAVKVAIGRYI